MRRWIHAWGTTVLAWGLVLVIGGAAIAGVGASSSRSDHAQGPSAEATGSESPEAEESEAPDSEDARAPEAKESPADNHGQCVSHWAHEAKDAGLEGSGFGAFVSSVAQSEETGEDCDFAEALATALADQEAKTSTADEARNAGHGRSGEEHGKPDTSGDGS